MKTSLFVKIKILNQLVVFSWIYWHFVTLKTLYCPEATNQFLLCVCVCVRVLRGTNIIGLYTNCLEPSEQQRHVVHVAGHPGHQHLPAMVTPPYQTHWTTSMHGLKLRMTWWWGSPTPSHVRVLCLTSADVRKTPCRVNTWKAAGPDHTAGRFLASNFNLCTIAEVKEVPQINTNIVTNRKNEGRAHNSQRTSNVQCVYYIRLKWMKNCLLETVLVVCGTKCLNDQTVNLHLFYVLTEV